MVNALRGEEAGAAETKHGRALRAPGKEARLTQVFISRGGASSIAAQCQKYEMEAWAKGEGPG